MTVEQSFLHLYFSNSGGTKELQQKVLRLQFMLQPSPPSSANHCSYCLFDLYFQASLISDCFDLTPVFLWI